jgi:hypothetical protein
MITVEGMKITISYGDTFLVTFNLCGYSLVSTDTIKFTVKDCIDSEIELLTKELTGLTGTAFTIEIDRLEFMEAVGKGNKVYDLLLSYGDINPETQKKNTLNFPARLIVKDVVHNE